MNQLMSESNYFISNLLVFKDTWTPYFAMSTNYYIKQRIFVTEFVFSSENKIHENLKTHNLKPQKLISMIKERIIHSMSCDILFHVKKFKSMTTCIYDTSLPCIKVLKAWQFIYIFRETETPQRGFGSVLPRHNPDYNKFHLESTHKADFTPPDPNYIPVPVSMT